MKSELYFPKDETKVSVGRVIAPEVVVPAENEDQRVLRLALERLGPNGERWCQCQLTSESGQHCIMGALDAVTDVLTRRRLVRAYINPIIGPQGQPETESCWPMFWNDHFSRNFQDVRAMFLRAIDLAA